MKTNIFTRNELYNLVWSKPVSKILLHYALSDVAFKNLCRDNDIPLPKNGYWQKLKHNKKVVPTLLPKALKEYPEIKLPTHIEGEKGLSKLSELNLLIREIKNDKSLPIYVSSKLTKPDKIILTTKKHLAQLKKSKRKWEVKAPSEGVFSIAVSHDLEKRALLFIEALIKLFRKRGHDVKVLTNQKYYNYNGSKLIVFGEYFDVRIRESNKRTFQETKYGWKEAIDTPSGKLTLKLDGYPKYVWRDTAKTKIEDKLAHILAYLELRAKKEIKESKERKIWREEYDRNKKIEEELKIKIAKELTEFKAIISQSSRWQKAMDLRNYIKAVEENASKNHNNSLKLNNWLNWIKDKADWYDPLIEKDDELFKNIDRDTLGSLK